MKQRAALTKREHAATGQIRARNLPPLVSCLHSRRGAQ
jgi:hypothetical protein